MSVCFEIVVSSENTPYLAWQTQLFCYSALSRLQKYPTVIVHGTADPLRHEFRALSTCGFRVERAPSFSAHPRAFYPARNEVGSLWFLANTLPWDSPYLLFCEPDMLFTSSPTYHGELAAEHYSYLDYSQPRIMSVARKFNVGHEIHRANKTKKVGVPYLLPGRCLGRVANRWLEVLDTFDDVTWIDIMYAFGICLMVERLEVAQTELVQDNHLPLAPLSASIIHYCYGDFIWDKRRFMGSQSPLDASSRCRVFGGPGTVLRELVTQINEAKTFFQRWASETA